jgi:hypothetical protein
MIHLNIKFHMPSLNNSLAIDIKLIAKENWCVVTTYYFTLYKIYLKKGCIFF